MTTTVEQLRGITPELAQALKSAGIRNNEQLLNAAATPKQRRSLGERFWVDDRVVLEFANRADLARIKGVGGAFSDLLERAGVDTVKELAQRRPDNLYQKIISTNKEKQLTGILPSEKMVQDWVQQAKAMDKVLSY